MKNPKISEENIKAKEYFDNFYSTPAWEAGGDNVYERMNIIMNLVDKEYEKHLDVACGTGVFTKKYLEKFPNTEGWGIDISDTAIKEAKKYCPKGNFVMGDGYYLPFEDKKFDLVTCFYMLGHVENPEIVLDELIRVAKDSAVFIITMHDNIPDGYNEKIWRFTDDGERIYAPTILEKDLILKKLHIIKEYPNFVGSHVLYIEACKRRKNE